MTEHNRCSCQLSYPPHKGGGVGLEPTTYGSQSEVTVMCNAVVHIIYHLGLFYYSQNNQKNRELFVYFALCFMWSNLAILYRNFTVNLWNMSIEKVI